MDTDHSKLRDIQVYYGLVLDIMSFVLQCRGTDSVSPRIIKTTGGGNYVAKTNSNRDVMRL